MRISAYDVRDVMQPSLGSAIADNMDFCNRIADVMRDFNPASDSFEAVKENLQDIIFNAIYDFSGERMLVRRDDGSVARVYMRDLPMIADDALGAMFRGMPVYSASYQQLKEYALRDGSLAAMRVLFEKYDRFQSPEEKETLVKVIKGYPSWRYQGWLTDGETEAKGN